LTVECPYCDARVDAKEIATYQFPSKEQVDECRDDWPDEEDLDVDVDMGDIVWPYRATLLVCIACNQVLLAYQESGSSCHVGQRWSEPKRVYPPEQALDLPVQIPEGIRKSLEEAKRCLKAKAYPATAVMCGRAVEGLCRHFNAGAYLGSGLSELKTRGIIDGVILQWGEELQRHRNIGAHAGEASINKDDAVDLFEFAFAICQYVFVFGEKFRKFKERTGPGGNCGATVQ
jgi:Domain of unknown function (DUF4145)